ncbi:MAG: S-layer family protein, partial [Rivularia sp. (in: cyanobacteria)]
MFFRKLNFKLVNQLIILAAIFSGTNSVKAQEILPDNTLPNNSQINLENNITKITGGTQRGGNLFHSFEKFGIPTGRELHFDNNLDINNIINRVTGGNISNIDGLIKANGAANLFLINPSGIVFGENAKLDIGGSFVGSTANALGFGEDNFFSASNPEESSLLSINPNALFFNQLNPSASIENNSVADLGLEDVTIPIADIFFDGTTESFTPKGLRVDDGKSLLLVGSNFTMNGGGLVALGGNVELGGLAATGTVGLNSDGSNFSLNFPDAVERSNVTLTDGASVIVAAEDSGSIAVNARNLEMTEESFLLAGIDTGLGSEQSRGGNIDINIADAIALKDGSRISNLILTEARGQGGDININTNSLLLETGAKINGSTFGEGSAGNLNVYADDVQVIGEFRYNQSFSSLATIAYATGDGGDSNINTNTLLIKDGAALGTGTFGEGNSGNLNVYADDVQVIGTSQDGQFLSILSTQTQTIGDGGDLNINTNTLQIQNGAQVLTGTFGEGNAGNLTIDASYVEVIGTVPVSLFSSLLSTQTGSKGSGGDLNINTNTLLLEDGGQVTTATFFGEGNAGNLTINANSVQVIGTSQAGGFPSFLVTGTQSTGDGGNLSINTNTLLIENGAQVLTTTFSEGNAGNLSVYADDVQVIGNTVDRLDSYLSAGTDSTGDGGNLSINTNTLLLQDGGVVLTATQGEGNAGNLTVKASSVKLIGTTQVGEFYSLLSTQTGSSSEFSEINSSTLGDGGDLTITTDILQVEDGAIVTARSLGTGRAGNLIINADSIRLNNDGLLSANTRSNRVNPEREQATININSQDLILRRSSNILTNATGENVIGGSININSDVIAALENSDISANSANFRGGNVNIISQGIFGTQFRNQVTPGSDITATGADSESSGSVTIDGLEQNPAETLTELPSIPVSGEVYQACQPNDGSQSEFYFTGNGGLPPNPRDFLTSESVDIDWVSLPNQVEKASGVEVGKIKYQNQNRIVEATGLVKDKNGDVFLVAQA